MRALHGVVLVTGTGTGVGKTVVTAALAVAALEAGHRVRVVKPVQTGVSAGQVGDADEVARLVAPVLAERSDPQAFSVHEFVRLPEPLAPQAAAARAGVRLPPIARHATRIAQLAGGLDLTRDLVLVEGAGGVLVRLDGAGATLVDLPADGVVVVTGPELGTLNVTELTVEALRRRGVPVLGLVLGRWPTHPGPAEQGNRIDLPRLTGVALLGGVPEGPPVPPRVNTSTPGDGAAPD